MKTTGFTLIFILTALVQHSHANKTSQLAEKYLHTETEAFSQTLRFEDQGDNNHIRIFNVYGSIDVQGHTGDGVLIEATNQVFANTKKLIQEGINEIGLKVEQSDHEVLVYLNSPYTYIDKESGKIRHSDSCWRHDDCSRKHLKRKAYKYHMDIKVKIPENTSINVSTINNGDITITGIDAKRLSVNNINGAIDMNDVAGQIDAYAINKDINISYRTNPNFDSSYESINGDLNVTFAGQPNSEVTYKTSNGAFYSSFDVSMLAPKVERIVEQKKHGIQYKLDANSRLRVGTGGPELRFETLNGDIKIQRQ